MQEDDGGTRLDHVVMNGYHIETMLTKRLENPVDFVFEHGHITCHSCSLVVAHEGSPRVQAHPRVDQGAHLSEL